jgi:ABC-type amino acid transport substrate-binding protein
VRFSLVAAAVAVLATFSPQLSRADAVMTYVYHPPESSLDVRYLYHWEILRTALEKTKPKWGAYQMRPSAFMTEQRQAFELKNATGRLTVMYLSTTPEFEKTLVPIRIPVDKNLGGYSVFLIRKSDQPRFAPVKTLDDLHRFSYGLGLGWIDVGILRHSGFNVVTGSSYDGLFEMLVQKRFDVFLRAAVEVLDEYDRRKRSFPDLYIENGIILYYALPMYFWFSRTAEGRRLAARAEEGMRMMIADGSYDAIFDKYQRPKIERLRLKERRIFRIDNPNVGPETPFGDKKLWFDPQTYK